MNDDALQHLRRADPARHLPSIQEHWRTREEVIMKSVAPPTTPRQPRRPAFALAALAVGAAVAGITLSGGADQLEPIRIASTPAGVASEMTTPADAKMALWTPQEFTLDPGVDAPATDRTVYRFTTASRADVEALAEQLGLTGEIQVDSLPAAGSSYQLGSLYASSNGSFSWSNDELLNDPAYSSRLTVSCTSPSLPDGDAPLAEPPLPPDAFTCGDPTPPSVELPTDAAAIEMVQRLVPTARVEVASRSSWSVSLTVGYGPTDTEPAPLGYAEVDDRGVLYVSGMFTALEVVGEYPTISPALALPRLTGGNAAPGRPVPAIEAIEPAPIPTDRAAVVEPGFHPVAPTRVSLVAVDTALMSLWDVEGTVWLVPSWRYRDAAGAVYDAVALHEDYLVETSPFQEPLPAEPMPGVAPPGAGGSEPAVDVAAYVGMSEDDARIAAEHNGLSVRVVARDGEQYAVTKDLRPDRVNFTIDDGTVVGASLG